MASGWRKKQRKIFSTESSAGRWYLEHKTRCFNAALSGLQLIFACSLASLSSSPQPKRADFRFQSMLLTSYGRILVHAELKISNSFSGRCSASMAFTAYGVGSARLQRFHRELAKTINMYIKTTLDQRNETSLRGDPI